jgi:hypothetical protein
MLVGGRCLKFTILECVNIQDVAKECTVESNLSIVGCPSISEFAANWQAGRLA